MSKLRLLFKKEGKSIYISHLDLMRTMQRAFVRAGIQIRHTEGFNPHPYMSFALPLSVGCASICELMDFEGSEALSPVKIPEMLSAKMPDGITVTSAYEPVRKLSEIVWLHVEGSLIYDNGLLENIDTSLNSFFHSDSIVIPKKSKKGISDFDIIPCIHDINFTKNGENEVRLHAVIAAQNPSLNPEYLIRAIREKIPEFCPDFATFTRIEVFDKELNIFR